MKARLLNAGGYKTCASMTFPCEVEVKEVTPRQDGGPYGLISVAIDELIAKGGTAGHTDDDETDLSFVYDVEPLFAALLGFGDEAELVEE